MSERSGIALNTNDSGWPVASSAEAQPHKDGTGADPHPKATQVLDGVVHAAGEAQRITVTATGGTFTLTFSGQTTGAITVSGLTAAALKTALEALSNIAPGDVVVNQLSAGVFEVYFAGTLAGADQPAITADAALATGGTVTVDTVATV